jgi:tetratricopeptide (TPR) repeat protein
VSMVHHLPPCVYSGMYAHAYDCSQDWLLWNRVGATLANSGHADQALEYYARAIEMNPLYIRARYNMGIALSNLKVSSCPDI